MDRQTVAIVYGGMGEGSIEETLLGAINANIVRVTDLDAPEVREADALMVTIQPVRAPLLETLTRCQIVSRVGVGLDNIDIPAATACGIWVVNVPDYAIEEVSIHAIALTLAHMRRIPTWAAETRAGQWNGHAASTLRRPSALTFGVLGFGRIGSATAAKAQGLGMRVIAHDPLIDPAVITGAGVEAVSWETLLSTADYLSLHVPLTDATRTIINADTLAQMKPSAFLVNTARGGVVDETALLDALTHDRLAGAALDVLTTEPPSPDHPLLRHPRVIVTPHVAWGSVEASHDVRAKGTQEVIRVLRGERPRFPANEVSEVNGLRPLAR